MPALTTTSVPPLDRSQVIAALSDLRREWDEALQLDGECLETANERVLLEEIAQAIGLLPLEVEIVMGRLRIGLHTGERMTNHASHVSPLNAGGQP